MGKKTNSIALYPSPGIGHLVSMVELGKRFLSLPNTSFSITILIAGAPFNTGSTTPYIRRVSSSHPSISFHHLPPVSLPPTTSSSTRTDVLNFRLSRLNNPLVHEALRSLSCNSSIRVLVLDFFCVSALSIADQLGIPPYFFVTLGASALTTFLYFPTLHRLHTVSLKDLDTNLIVPGFLPFPPSYMPLSVIDRNHESYDDFLFAAIHMSKAKGIIINTFEALEPRAIKAIMDGSCVTDGPTPPVCCVGPLIATEEIGDSSAESNCLKWLESQPSRSVVFLSFGSLGLFSAVQLKEIAVGLEKSGHRFLWVVRSPPTNDNNHQILAPSEPDLDSLLPDGFLDRTRGRGMVVKSWAPQVAVLGRQSVGGFVTHCGWNSVLESLCGGVPMVAWPLYAEQRLNKVFLVEDMKLALPLEEDENGIVTASELERRVRGLMESEEGKAIAERAMAMKQKALEAMSLGGSSHTSLTELAELWNQVESHNSDQTQ